jgi:hypothetical protein
MDAEHAVVSRLESPVDRTRFARSRLDVAFESTLMFEVGARTVERGAPDDDVHP